MNKFNFIIKFLKRNLFSCICALLFTLVIFTGSISYAKYNISQDANNNSNLGSFSVSATIDNVSGFSFTNTSFWSSNSDDEKIAMNALRTLNFSINNFKYDDNGKQIISDVKLKYNLNFSTPKNFAEKLAIQVFDSENSPILPQIVINDLIKSFGGKYKTENSEDYNGVDTNDLEFNVVKNSDKFYTATSNLATITIEEYEKSVDQTLLFRMWDTSSITSSTTPKVDTEGGKVLPPLEISFSQIVTFYKISIVTNNFTLPAGKAKTDNFSIKLVPTEIISDMHLGGTIVDVVKDINGNIINSNNIEEIYGESNKSWYIQSTKEVTSENYYDNSNFTGTPLQSTEPEETIITSGAIIYKNGTESSSTDVSNTTTIGTPETTITNSVEDGEISWGEYTILDTEPTKSNYNKNYLAKTVMKENKYGTIFYIHKLKAKRTGTQEIKYITTETTITPINTVQKQSEIQEDTIVKRIDGEEEVILLNKTIKTTTRYVGNMKVDTKTTTTTYKRTYTQEGFIYRGYYKNDSGDLKYWGEVADDRKNPLFEISTNDGNSTTITNKSYYIETMNIEKESHIDKEMNSSTTSSENQKINKVTTTNYEYIQTKIIRSYIFNEIAIDKVTWTKLIDDETKTFTYDENNKLEFFSADIQKLFLASCYSKSYPFYVNVLFEQEQ